MSNEQVDPNTHRLIQTRDGVVPVPRTQTGVPITEYFRNAELPADITRAVVFETKDGPVLGKRDPLTWTAEHAEQAADYANRLKAQIDEKGYYRKTMEIYAARLADQTGHPKDEMKAVIADAFQRDHGADPFTYLQDSRRAQGLPVREASGPHNGPEQDQGG